jgi:hypothetical protein
VTMLPSHSHDDAVETTWPRARCRCRVMLVTMLPRRLGLGTMWMLSHADDNAAESCW